MHPIAALTLIAAIHGKRLLQSQIDHFDPLQLLPGEAFAIAKQGEFQTITTEQRCADKVAGKAHPQQYSLKCRHCAPVLSGTPRHRQPRFVQPEFRVANHTLPSILKIGSIIGGRQIKRACMLKFWTHFGAELIFDA